MVSRPSHRLDRPDPRRAAASAERSLPCGQRRAPRGQLETQAAPCPIRSNARDQLSRQLSGFTGTVALTSTHCRCVASCGQSRCLHDRVSMRPNCGLMLSWWRRRLASAFRSFLDQLDARRRGDLGRPVLVRNVRRVRMTDTDDKAGLTVRVIVKLRPDEYDELFRHVRRIGSTMSAFLRESAARAIKEGQPVALGRALMPEIPIAPDQTSRPCADIPTRATS